jgi:hypothetical protein
VRHAPAFPALRPGGHRYEHGAVGRSQERRPIGTNGYVSTWGALTNLRPPEGI